MIRIMVNNSHVICHCHLIVIVDDDNVVYLKCVFDDMGVHDSHH